MSNVTAQPELEGDPPEGLKDAVRKLVRDKFIGIMCDEHHADDIINIIIAAVQPLFVCCGKKRVCQQCGKRVDDIFKLTAEQLTSLSEGHLKCVNARLIEDNDRLKEQLQLKTDILDDSNEAHERIVIHLDTAVGLLDRYCNSTYAGDPSLSTLYRKTHDLLDTDWAKAILKQKGK